VITRYRTSCPSCAVFQAQYACACKTYKQQSTSDSATHAFPDLNACAEFVHDSDERTQQETCAAHVLQRLWPAFKVVLHAPDCKLLCQTFSRDYCHKAKPTRKQVWWGPMFLLLGPCCPSCHPPVPHGS
jgi:hypothetical protein